MHSEIRIPKQKRSIKKKEKIIDAGWKLITKDGYYNTNTAEIAKKAGVSTGIVYQYFNDKHDILIEGLNKYGDEIFFPMIVLNESDIKIDNLANFMSKMIYKYIKDHKVSAEAHEEIMAMIHIDKDVAEYYYNREIALTNDLYQLLIDNNYNSEFLLEKVHIMIGMVDHLCHEIVYHQHSNLDYKAMCKIVIDNIDFLIKTKK